MGIMNNDRVRIRNIQTRFDNVGGNQYIVFTFNKLHHYFFQFVTIHLAMSNSNSGIRNKFENSIGHLLDITNSIMYEKNLPSPTQLLAYGIANNYFIKCVKLCCHGLPIRWRRRNDTEITSAHQ